MAVYYPYPQWSVRNNLRGRGCWYLYEDEISHCQQWTELSDVSGVAATHLVIVAPHHPNISIAYTPQPFQRLSVAHIACQQYLLDLARY